ncbi:MAG: molybdenum cofactor guanylyltransferase [Methanomicrobiales archaeon]|nr:molybdenum cofactor guanylyltransferase [Methanomicrobiales archaeon]MDI6875156.1 molybdenum cofactor guanylyltransferase [Methanomicrobiales archaeon]
MRSGIVLVGGEARRAGGQEKYFFEYQGKTFLERLISTLQGVVDEIILVAKDIEQCERFSHLPRIICISDIRRGIGPIGGLHAGVVQARGEKVFVAACDMPCINREVIEFLFSRLEDYDAVIPVWDGERMEPLHAVYRRSALLAYLEEHEALSLRAMVRALNSRYVNVEEIRRFDPELTTFININKVEELEAFNSRV